MIGDDGRVRCWGHNDRGQLGDGTNTASSVPIDIGWPASTITAGSRHTCAIVFSGVVCWGDNGHGQLGTGNQNDSSTPISVSLLTADIVDVAAGKEHTCALTSAGLVYCWGENGYGQLGTGPLNLDSNFPSLVVLSGSATAITAGENYTCVALANGGARCWGQNNYGQLGDGTETDRSLPTIVNGLSQQITSLDGGSQYTCAALENTSVSCWGNQTTDGGDPVPQTMIASGAASASVGVGHSCVTVLPNAVQCWGDDSQGQLGNGGTFVDSPVPTFVTLLPNDVLEIEAGGSHTCSLHASGAVYCWGMNARGQLGTGVTGGFVGSPVPVAFP